MVSVCKVTLSPAQAKSATKGDFLCLGASVCVAAAATTGSALGWPLVGFSVLGTPEGKGALG
eukprot:1168207-Lingulodinium_polyedra.AAC.1